MIWRVVERCGQSQRTNFRGRAWEIDLNFRCQVPRDLCFVITVKTIRSLDLKALRGSKEKFFICWSRNYSSDYWKYFFVNLDQKARIIRLTLNYWSWSTLNVTYRVKSKTKVTCFKIIRPDIKGWCYQTYKRKRHIQVRALECCHLALTWEKRLWLKVPTSWSWSLGIKRLTWKNAWLWKA